MDDQELFAQAQQLAKQGKRDEARKKVELYLEKNPDNVSAWLTLGDLTSNRDLSLRYYNSALNLDPSNEIAQKKIFRLVNSEPPKLLNKRLLSVGLITGIITLITIGVVIIFQIIQPNSLLKTKLIPALNIYSTDRQPLNISSTPPQTSFAELASPTASPTKRPTNTPAPTQTNESLPLFTKSAESYLPSLDMLPRTFYMEYITQIDEYGGQSKFQDSAFVGFHNDVPLNYHTDGIYLVAYHSFIFQNSLQATNFYNDQFGITGIIDYYNWIIARKETFSPELHESLEEDNLEIKVYTARLQGFELRNIGVFFAIRSDNLVYIMTAVSTETSSASIDNAISEAYSLLITPFDQIMGDD